MKKQRRRLCDRYDGRLVKVNDPFFSVIPHIMTNRTGSMVNFNEIIDVSNVDSYVHRKRREDIPDLRFLHVLIAAMVRTASQKPKTNRFVSGKKVYARSYIRTAVTVKKSLSEDALEEIIQPEFAPDVTIYDVVKQVNDEIETAFKNTDQNETAKAAKWLRICPGFLISFIVFLAKRLDAHGWMPKFLNKMSPFHCSVFITDMGSLGVGSVYHHLYDFGTCSVFIAIGKKERVPYFDGKELKEKKVIELRATVDERICDGFYFASTFKLIKKLLLNPELLELPPDQVILDSEAY